jgi:hypothetical protein
MHYIAPWVAAGRDASVNDYRENWERELRLEVGPRHCLNRQEFHLIARNVASDDGLFLLGDGRVAVVHLTWSSSQEIDPAWPATTIYESSEAWFSSCT